MNTLLGKAARGGEVLTAVENGGAGRSKTTALGGVDISSFVGVSRPL